MDLLATLRTTGAVREFTNQPVDDATIYRILDTARFAPSGGNRQAWRVVIVRDQSRRTALRDLYLSGWYEYVAQVSAGLVPWASITDRQAESEAIKRAPIYQERAIENGGGFAEHLEQTPVLLLILADLRNLATVDRGYERYTFAGGASVYPFAWNALLAARAEGLAGVITTMPIREEEAVKELFQVPKELAVAALMALGHPTHQPTRLKRNTVESFCSLDTFGGPAFTAPTNPN